MIKPKEKPCKGTGIALGYGCGKPTLYREAGLGKMCGCYSDWLLNSENGRIKMAKSMIKAKSIVKKEQSEKDKITRESLKTLSDYKQDLQKEINTIVRLIDTGHPCVATNTFEGKRNAGHYISVGSNDTLRYHLENIWIQSEHSNTWKSGDTLRYQEGIIKLFGKEYLDYMNNLQSIQPLKLTIPEIKVFIERARKIIKSLKDCQFTTEERISIRRKSNLELGIYQPQYCEFKN